MALGTTLVTYEVLAMSYTYFTVYLHMRVAMVTLSLKTDTTSSARVSAFALRRAMMS